jgi:hypothetical protein
MMKVFTVTLLLTLLAFLVQAQNTGNRQQQNPSPVRVQENERKQNMPAGGTVRQVKKERQSDKCCVRKSEVRPRKRD